MRGRTVNFRNRPKLGQNFLVSPAAQAATADALGDVSRRTVVEIGPGRGAITAMLARRAHRLIAIELDSALAAHLQADFADQASVIILNQNILSTDLAALAEAHSALTSPDRGDEPARSTVSNAAHTDISASSNAERFSRLSIVGNLPYYITSDILLHLFAAHRHIDRAVVMMQREVADRVAAHPGTRDYGLLSITAQLYARVEKLFTLPPGAFSPPPQVHSTVVRLTMAPRVEELRVDPDAFLGFVRVCFAQKRKTLANNLRAGGYDSETIASAIASCSIAPQARAEQLDLAAMAQLHRRLEHPARSPDPG